MYRLSLPPSIRAWLPRQPWAERLIYTLERDRRAGRPVRFVLRREVDDSTALSRLLTRYVLWLQTEVDKHSESVICTPTAADARATLGHVRSVLSPRKPLRRFEGATNVRRLPIADTSLREQPLLASYTPHSAAAIRGTDPHYLLLTDLHRWFRRPATLSAAIRASISGLSPTAGTLIILDYADNRATSPVASAPAQHYYNTALSHTTCFRPHDLPWYALPGCVAPVAHPRAFWRSMTLAERRLYFAGLSLRQLAWLRLHPEMPTPVSTFIVRRTLRHLHGRRRARHTAAMQAHPFREGFGVGSPLADRARHTAMQAHPFREGFGVGSLSAATHA